MGGGLNFSGVGGGDKIPMEGAPPYWKNPEGSKLYLRLW